MSLFQAVILGLVEGITEYLPISSTGHLIIAAALLGLDEPPEARHAVNAFIIAIQGGAILAILGLYRQRVAQMARGLVGRSPVGRRMLLNLIIAFLPAAAIGILLYQLTDIEALLFKPVAVVAALALGGVVMIFLTPWQRKFFHSAEGDAPLDAHTFVDIEHLTWRRALVIGLLQCLALWPGTSRSMATIMGGMVVGLRPRHAAEFSFLLGLPTLTAACLYKIAKNVLADRPDMFEVLGTAQLIVGTIVATISAAVAVKWLVGYLSRRGVALFGWYRLVIAAVIAILAYFGVLEEWWA